MNNWIDWVVCASCALFLLACTPTEPPAPTCHYTGLDGKEYACGSDTVPYKGVGTK